MIRTLIVEDDPMVAELAAGYLKRINGFRLEMIAGSGDEALTILETTHLDLVLLDVFMPGMDGMELLRAVKGSFVHTDVIMVTAARRSEDILQALRLGVADYIVKPFTFERFRDSLMQFHEKRRLLMSPEVSISQDMLDKRIFIKKTGFAEPSLPKGIDERTLAHIMAVLRVQTGPFSLKDIEPLTGISRISLKKYFDHLAENGSLGSDKNYSGAGRPATLYTWLD